MKIKLPLNNIEKNLKLIPRADNPNKCLSRSVRDLVITYLDLINKSAKGIIFVTHEFISNITEVGNRQNNRLHAEIKELFNIQYHKSVIVDGQKYRDGFTIELTENGENILKNPKGFYAIEVNK